MKDFVMNLNSSSIGIIGGADGPTAVMVSSSFSWYHYALIVAALAVLIVSVVYLVKRHKRK